MMSREAGLQQNAVSALPPVRRQVPGSVNVNNEDGGTVNVNYYPPQGTRRGSPEELFVIQGLRKEYYHLLVVPDKAFMKKSEVCFSPEQVLHRKRVPAEIYDKHLLMSEEGINELLKFPALICQRNTGFDGETEAEMYVFYSYIESIHVDDSIIRADFHVISFFRQRILCDQKVAAIFGLNMDCALTDLNKCGWSMHKRDLFTAFEQVGIKNMPCPL